MTPVARYWNGSAWADVAGVSVYEQAAQPAPDPGIGAIWIDTDAPEPPAWQRVTSLPASPTDGQTVVYVASATDAVLWTLRYNAGSASAYKWEFLGGSVLGAITPTGLQAIADSASAHDAATIDNGVLVPLAGDYWARYGCQADAATPDGTGQIYQNVYDASVGGTVPVGQDVAFRSSNFGSHATEYYLGGLIAGHTYRTRYRTAAGAGRRAAPYLMLTPVRVG